MSNQWHHISDDGRESGPLEMSQLLELVRTGRLRPADRLRKAGSDLALPAARVKGLFPEASAAERKPASELAAEPLRGGVATVAGGSRPGGRVKRIIGGVAVVVLCTGVAGWLSRTDPTFPQPLQVVVNAEREAARRNLFRAPTPRVPTLPSLAVGTPVLAPGLESLEPAYSPALTHDLRMIVFAAPGAKGRSLELYQSVRISVNAPFATPQLIESCSSPELDAYPALSPDGLELVFVRGHKEPALWYASRPQRQAPFGEPVLWEPPELHSEGLRLGRPQFVDGNRVALRRMASRPADSQTVLSARSGRDQPFQSPEPVLFSNAGPQFWLASHGLRAYAGSDRGVVVTARSREEYVFPPPRELLPVDVTGPIDGPLWVAPKEDVLVYCSAGPGEAAGSRRRLWMLRY